MADDCNGMPGPSTGVPGPMAGESDIEDVQVHSILTSVERGVDKGAVVARRRRQREDAEDCARQLGQSSSSTHELSRSIVLNAVVAVGAWISDHGLWESGWYGPEGVMAEEDVLSEIALTLDAARKRPRADKVFLLACYFCVKCWYVCNILVLAEAG